MARDDRRLHPDEPPGAEVRDEIRFYLEERAREFEAEGMNPEEAHRAARRAFGDPDAVEAEVRRIDRQRERDGRGGRVMGHIRQDLRFALRTLARHPGFTAVVVLTLGLGIGAVTAVFSVVDASLLRALPFAGADELVFLRGAYDDAEEGPQVRFASVPEARDWAAMTRSFEAVAAVDGEAVDLAGDDGTERLQSETVDRGYFELLQVSPTVGRAFTEHEYADQGAGRVVVLAHGLWTRRFGADPGVLGRTLVLDGVSHEVVGVAPEGFAGATLQAELWRPLSVYGAEALADRGSRYIDVVARLAPGVSLEAARADVANVALRLEEAHPDLNEDRIALVLPFREAYLGDTRLLVLVVLAAAGLLLVIAATNVVSLLLVRATTRRGEVLVRRALGVGRGRLLGQFAVEGLVLSAAGALAGLALGTWGAGALAAAMPDALLPPFVRVRPSVSVFALVATLLSAVGLAVGLAPGFAAVRRDLAGGLREAAGRGTGGGRVLGALVVGEVALALLLLVGAGLMARSFGSQLAVDPGFEHEELYAFSVDFPADRYPREGLTTSVTDLLARLEARPEVAEATAGSGVPLRSGYSATYLWREDAPDPDDRIRFYFHRVLPGWFETMGTPIVRGRPLDGPDALASVGDEEGEEEVGPTVVSRAMAARVFPGEDPIGRTLIVGGPDGPRFNIVGVAEDVRWRDLVSDVAAGADDPDVWLPWLRVPGRGLAFALRPQSGDPAALEAVVREVVSAFDGSMAVYADGPLADDLRAQTAQARFGSLLLASFSVLAAFLALIGLYGVLSFSVGRRRRELALRMAMGAGAGEVRRMVVIQGMRLAGGGLIVGLAAAAVATRSLGAFLFGVDHLDGATYAVVTALMAVVALAATWLPAHRATQVHPQAALKSD